MVLKMASLLSIHTCSLGAPILIEEAQTAGYRQRGKRANTCLRPMRAAGQWNVAWDAFYEIDPEWTEAFIVCGAPVYAGGILDPKLAELFSIAFDVSYTHMYAPGVRRHIKAALKLGAPSKRSWTFSRYASLKAFKHPTWASRSWNMS